VKVLLYVFYTFAWILIILNTFFFFKVIAKIRKEVNSRSDRERVDKITSKLKWYPIVQIVCIIPGTINRIYNLVLEDDSFILTLLQAIFDYSSGFLFALVYGLNPTIIKAIKELFSKCFPCCCKDKKSTKSLITVNDETSQNSFNISYSNINAKRLTFISSMEDD